MLGKSQNWVEGFSCPFFFLERSKIGLKTSIWFCIITHIYFWLNTENNADPYIIKHPYLSRTRNCDNEPQSTLFSWIGPALSLPHQSNAIDVNVIVTADHLQWTICVKTKSRVDICLTKTNAKLSRPSNPSVGKWKCISFIFVFYPFFFTS